MENFKKKGKGTKEKMEDRKVTESEGCRVKRVNDRPNMSPTGVVPETSSDGLRFRKRVPQSVPL